jgi:hypothetical protein
MPDGRNNFGAFDRFDAQMQFTGTAAPVRAGNSSPSFPIIPTDGRM